MIRLTIHHRGGTSHYRAFEVPSVEGHELRRHNDPPQGMLGVSCTCGWTYTSGCGVCNNGEFVDHLRDLFSRMK